MAIGDRGQYIVVSFPRNATLSGWAVADGEGRAPLGNGTVTGRVALTADPGPVANLTDALVRAVTLPDLPNGGERVRLVHGNVTFNTLTVTRPRGSSAAGTERGAHSVRPTRPSSMWERRLRGRSSSPTRHSYP